MIFLNPHRKPSGLETNGEASDDHEDAGQEEDEDEEDGTALHRDPVLDEEGKDVPGGGQGEPHLPPLLLLLLLLGQVKAKLFWLAGARPQFILLYLNGNPWVGHQLVCLEVPDGWMISTGYGMG